MEEDTLFTPEAERALADEAERLSAELRKESVEQALRTRGKPVEVTASDVTRARSLFVKRDLPLLPLTEMLLRAYADLGVLLILGGGLYPVVRPLLDNVTRLYASPSLSR